MGAVESIMKIDSASYSLASSHLALSHDESHESLRAWRGSRRPDHAADRATVSLSSGARAALVADIRAAIAALPAPQAAAPAPEMVAIQKASDAADNDPFLSLIKSMVEMLTGQPIRVFSAQDVQRPQALPQIANPNAAPTQADTIRPAGFGIEYDYHAVHEEFEQTQVAAQGTIKTADGHELSFRLDLSMTRSYREETSVSLRAGDAVRKDPLVLNFDGTAAQLSDRRFMFDLDGDGQKENMALLGGGSAYLAIDRNGNGKIDSGRELFGPTTDSGFGELAALDSDGNHWIDENDPVFQSLRIWTPEANGNGMVGTLQQRRIGAIALNHVVSPFELRGSDNSQLGAIKASGIFISEAGKVGAVQEIDLSV